jgi:glycosyltransferase involved in cell wall biosynthesis
MRPVNKTPPFQYQDPWNLSLTQRLAKLGTGKRKIAYFYHRADNSTFRYRIYNSCQVLNSLSRDISASFFFIADAVSFDAIATCADQLVICRTPYCREANNLISRFKALGKRVTFDIDDLVFNPNHAQLVASTIGHPLETEDQLNSWYGYVGRQYTTMQLCDDFVTTNEFLADQIRDFTGRPTRVLRNFMNREQIDYSAHVIDNKPAPSGHHEVFRIGYFSGSPSHAHDFELAAPAILRIMREDPTVELTIAGYIDPPGADKSLSSRIHKIPFTDFVNLQREISHVDLNIVPLQYNTFTNCKSELKYFEAAAVGVPTAASPIYSYSNCIRHGENGYLVKAHEWESTLRQIIEGRSELASISERARQHSQQQYSWENMLPETIQSLGID